MLHKFRKLVLFRRELQRNIEKDRLTEENKRRIRLKHADCVRKQIVDKETIQLAERKAVFEEGIKMEEEARQRKLRLEAVKTPKKNLISVEKALNHHSHYEKPSISHLVLMITNAYFRCAFELIKTLSTNVKKKSSLSYTL